MYKWLVDQTAPFFARGLRDSADYAAMRYGMTAFLINAVKTLLLIVVAVCMGIQRQVFVFALGYGVMRTFSFGVHFRHPAVCTVHGLLFLLGGSMLGAVLPDHPLVTMLLIAVPSILYWRYAPAPTAKRPMSENNRRKFHKKTMAAFCIITVLGIALATCGQATYANLLMTGAAFQSINILPVWQRTTNNSNGGQR